MKKIISLLLALALAISLSITAFAGGGDSHDYSPNDGTILGQKVTTTVPDNQIMWHLEIPAEVTITIGGYEGYEDVKNVKISIDNGELTDKQKIEASMQYDGKMALEEDINIKLDYVLSDKAVFNSGNYDETLETDKAYVVGTKTKSDETYNSPYAWVRADEWYAAQSGNYAGAIVYSSALVESD